MQHRRVGETLDLVGRKVVLQLEDRRGQRIATCAPIDDAVRAVVGVVPAGSEGEARAIPLALEAREEALALGTHDLDESIAFGPRRVAGQLDREDHRSSRLARVLDPMVRTDEGTRMRIALTQHPVQHAMQWIQ